MKNPLRAKRGYKHKFKLLKVFSSNLANQARCKAHKTLRKIRLSQNLSQKVL